jgi:sigma-B regulation protein RsbU (phosphoserine phosphatase)
LVGENGAFVVVTAETLRATPKAGSRDGVRLSAILVVDDSKFNRDVLCHYLTQRGYTATAAADGSQALEMIARGGFDLVLLDIIMPVVNGLEVLRTLRQRFSAAELPIIMTTGMGQSEDIVRALELGANDYVTKPLDVAVVAARIRTHLSLRNSVQQIRDLEERLSRRNRELEAANAQLEATNSLLARAHDHMRRDLIAAAKVQEAFLPRSPIQLPGLNAAWTLRPCEELAGDSLNILRLDADHVGIYVLDVSGHGIAAALLAVTVTHALSAGSSGGSLLVQSSETARVPRVLAPAEVVERLNLQFPCDPETGRFFTIIYGVINLKTRELCYASAGHPHGLYLGRSTAPMFLESTGLPVGLGGSYQQHMIRLNPGDRLYLYTDGITEATNRDGHNFGRERLRQAIARDRSMSLQDSISGLLEDLQQWNGAVPLRDDVSVLALEAV